MGHDSVLSHKKCYTALLDERLSSGRTGWSDLVVGHNAKACRRKHEVEGSDYAEEGIEAHRLGAPYRHSRASRRFFGAWRAIAISRDRPA